MCLKYEKFHCEVFQLPLTTLSLQVTFLVLLSDSNYHLLILKLTACPNIVLVTLYLVFLCFNSWCRFNPSAVLYTFLQLSHLSTLATTS